MRKPFAGDYKITMKHNQPASWFKGGKHLGVDWACPKGTPLVAAFDGVITLVAPWQMTGYGRQVNLRSSDSQFEAIYGHLSEIKCQLNAVVKKGDIIGLSGNSGLVISLGGGGYHLHFGLKKNGTWVDPLQYIENENQIKIPVCSLDPEPVPEKQTYITTGYIVKRGDTLGSIAVDFYGDVNKWKKIFYANTDVIKNPNKIYPKQVLKIPGYK